MIKFIEFLLSHGKKSIPIGFAIVIGIGIFQVHSMYDGIMHELKFIRDNMWTVGDMIRYDSELKGKNLLKTADPEDIVDRRNKRTYHP